ncbi:MAG: GNAT family N-acetyltransferase [Desulfocapsa sp.]|nr:GNAT family N-acetyltransferase [Desulfocapsa sp.]
MNYQHLPLTEDDLVECSQLYIDTFKHAPWNEEWQIDDAFDRLSNFLSPLYSIGIKVVKDNEILGFFIGEIEQWNGVKNFYLKEICVSNSMQRSGLGKELIVVLQKELEGRGVPRIYLITQRETIPEWFYSSLGFTANQSLIIMSKDIKKSR